MLNLQQLDLSHSSNEHISDLMSRNAAFGKCRISDAMREKLRAATRDHKVRCNYMLGDKFTDPPLGQLCDYAWDF